MKTTYITVYTNDKSHSEEVLVDTDLLDSIRKWDWRLHKVVDVDGVENAKYMVQAVVLIPGEGKKRTVSLGMFVSDSFYHRSLRKDATGFDYTRGNIMTGKLTRAGKTILGILEDDSVTPKEAREMQKLKENAKPEADTTDIAEIPIAVTKPTKPSKTVDPVLEALKIAAGVAVDNATRIEIDANGSFVIRTK